MSTRALPDMYALSPRASGIHIRQSTRAHVITYTYIHIYIYIYTTLTPKIKEKGMHIYLISHTQVCDIKNIAHLFSLRHSKLT